jgi:hypothetical protein
VKSVPATPASGPLSSAEADLLQRFPPGEGWSATRFGEIQHRRINLKREPTEQEDAFCKAFSAWQTAVDKSRQGKAGVGKSGRRR